MTVDAAVEFEVAEKAKSEMGTVAASIQSVASALSGTDNPVALFDWFFSFLKTLEKFNGVVDKIATVSITLHLASQSMIFRLSRFILTRKQRGLSSLLFPR